MKYDDFASLLQGVKGKTARCPAHDDRQNSLSHDVKNGKIVVHCHAGCATEDIVAAMGLEMSDLFEERNHKMDIAKTYNYLNEKGEPIYQAVRLAPKSFRQRRPDGNGGWVWNMKGIQPIPYRLPELLEALKNGKVVFVVEGEKDADNLAALGVTATTNHGGAGKWQASHSGYFPAGAKVIVLPDNDEPGRKHARNVANQLTSRGVKTKVLDLPGLVEKGDVSDWVAAGGTREELFRLAAEAKTWENKEEPNEPEPEQWEAPIPLCFHDLPPFPANIFPAWLGRYVGALAMATQTPYDLAGMLALSVLGTATQKKFQIQAGPGWTEPLNIWTVTALPSGNRKSGVFVEMAKPIEEWECIERDRLSGAIEKQKTERDILEQALQQSKNMAAKATGTDRVMLTREAQELAVDLAALDVPAFPQFVVDDCTPEAMAKLLAAQGGKLSVLSPEGDIFDILAGRYSGSANLGSFLKAHAGDTIRVNRVGRQPDFIQNPALTMGLTVQPDVLGGLTEKPGFRGRGFLGRFLYSLPVSTLGHRDVKPSPIPEHIASDYTDNVKGLFKLPGNVDDGGNPIAYTLRLSGQAASVFIDFQRWLEPQLAKGADLADMTDWAGKLAGAVARIAGLLHMAKKVDTWNEPVGLDTMEAAIRLGSEYLIPHAKASFAEMGADPEIEAAKAILEWVGQAGVETFTKRDLFNAVRGQSRFKKVKDLDNPLGILLEHNYLRELEIKRGGPGRKPSPVLGVNPHTQNTQNTQNSKIHPQKFNSAYIADIADVTRNPKTNVNSPPEYTINGNTVTTKEGYVFELGDIDFLKEASK